MLQHAAERAATVQNHESLGEALQNISTFMHLPQFRTKLRKGFAFEDFREALE